MNQYKNGIVSDFLPGESGWDSEMNTNLKRIDALFESSVNGFVATLPSSPANGDSYINTSTNTLNIYYNSAWLVTSLIVGSLYLNKDDGYYYQFDGTGMAVFTGAPSISDTAGSTDQNKLLITNSSGFVGAKFIGSLPSFSSDAAFEAFYGLPVGGERYYNTTSETFKRHLGGNGGWRDEGSLDNVVSSSIETSGIEVSGGADFLGDINIVGAANHSISPEFANESRDSSVRQKQLLVAAGAFAKSNIGAINISTGEISSNQTITPELTITTSGRPVAIGMMAKNFSADASRLLLINQTVTTGTKLFQIKVMRDGLQVAEGINFSSRLVNATAHSFGLPGIIYIDNPPAGEYDYSLDVALGFESIADLKFQFIVYELS